MLARRVIVLDFHFSSQRNVQIVSGDEEFKIVSMHVAGETVVVNKPMKTITYMVLYWCLLAAESCFISTSQNKVDNDVTGPEIK